MRPLANPLHEKFAWLIAEGETATAAYRKLRPDAKNAKVLGSKIWARMDVRKRVAEIYALVDKRKIMGITEKRDILRQQIEGTIPTRVTKRGKTVELVYDRLGAMMLDCKLAGEFDTGASSPDDYPSLKFKLHHR